MESTVGNLRNVVLNQKHDLKENTMLETRIEVKRHGGKLLPYTRRKMQDYQDDKICKVF